MYIKHLVESACMHVECCHQNINHTVYSHAHRVISHQSSKHYKQSIVERLPSKMWREMI